MSTKQIIEVLSNRVEATFTPNPNTEIGQDRLFGIRLGLLTALRTLLQARISERSGLIAILKEISNGTDNILKMAAHNELFMQCLRSENGVGVQEMRALNQVTVQSMIDRSRACFQQPEQQTQFQVDEQLFIINFLKWLQQIIQSQIEAVTAETTPTTETTELVATIPNAWAEMKRLEQFLTDNYKVQSSITINVQFLAMACKSSLFETTNTMFLKEAFEYFESIPDAEWKTEYIGPLYTVLTHLPQEVSQTLRQRISTILSNRLPTYSQLHEINAPAYSNLLNSSFSDTDNRSLVVRHIFSVLASRSTFKQYQNKNGEAAVTHLLELFDHRYGFGDESEDSSIATLAQEFLEHHLLDILKFMDQTVVDRPTKNEHGSTAPQKVLDLVARLIQRLDNTTLITIVEKFLQTIEQKVSSSNLMNRLVTIIPVRTWLHRVNDAQTLPFWLHCTTTIKPGLMQNQYFVNSILLTVYETNKTQMMLDLEVASMLSEHTSTIIRTGALTNDDVSKFDEAKWQLRFLPEIIDLSAKVHGALSNTKKLNAKRYHEILEDCAKLTEVLHDGWRKNKRFVTFNSDTQAVFKQSLLPLLNYPLVPPETKNKIAAFLNKSCGEFIDVDPRKLIDILALNADSTDRPFFYYILAAVEQNASMSQILDAVLEGKLKTEKIIGFILSDTGAQHIGDQRLRALAAAFLSTWQSAVHRPEEINIILKKMQANTAWHTYFPTLKDITVPA